MTSEDEHYIIEYITVGKAMKVTAFDPTTLTEAVIVAPPGGNKDVLSKLAVRKLEYLLARKEKP